VIEQEQEQETTAELARDVVFALAVGGIWRVAAEKKTRRTLR